MDPITRGLFDLYFRLAPELRKRLPWTIKKVSGKQAETAERFMTEAMGLKSSLQKRLADLDKKVQEHWHKTGKGPGLQFKDCLETVFRAEGATTEDHAQLKPLILSLAGARSRGGKSH